MTTQTDTGAGAGRNMGGSSHSSQGNACMHVHPSMFILGWYILTGEVPLWLQTMTTCHPYV